MVNNVLRKFRRHCKWAGKKPIGKLNIHTLRKCAGQNWADYLPMNVVKEFQNFDNFEDFVEEEARRLEFLYLENAPKTKRKKKKGKFRDPIDDLEI